MIIVYTEVWNRKKNRSEKRATEIDADTMEVGVDGVLMLLKEHGVVDAFATGQWLRARVIPELMIKNLAGDVIVKEKLGTAKEDS